MNPCFDKDHITLYTGDLRHVLPTVVAAVATVAVAAAATAAAVAVAAATAAPAAVGAGRVALAGRSQLLCRVNCDPAR